uniref:Fe2OG dioxygenase domain-containing protein n=1 Tax=Oryza punctata TaxID=4537 RepID=A0A0E0L8I9_ORYPU
MTRILRAPTGREAEVLQPSERQGFQDRRVYGNDMVVSEKQILDWCDRDVLREYTVRCREITGLVLNKLAKLLGLSEGYFLLRQGVWYDVPIIPNALLINVGDGIEIMSNGLFKSPVHRVVTNAERERVSLAMFYTLDPEKELEPVPELVDDEKRLRQYGKVKTKDYVTGLFETFARGTQVIDTVKISDNLNEIGKSNLGKPEFFRRRIWAPSGERERRAPVAAAAAELSLSLSTAPHRRSVGTLVRRSSLVSTPTASAAGVDGDSVIPAAMADGHEWKIVKVPPIVQELAASVPEPPSQYVVREQDRPAITGSAMPEPIPVIDLSRLSASDDDNSAGELAKLHSALENWGLFLAVGHGIEPGFLSEVMKVTRGFYELPLEEKQKYSNLANGDEFRNEGYGNDMVMSEEQILDWEITSLVLTKLAKLLGLREGYFVDMFDENATTYARFNYYPRCLRPEHVFGLKPHSDGSVITVASVDDTVSGLQVLRQGVWYNVPVIMSNGLLKSPVHRVVTNAERERVSVVMFYALDPEKELEPSPELVDDEKRPRQYAKTKTKDYLSGVYETFARGTRRWMLPTIVQELAASGVQEPPSRYVRRELQPRLAATLPAAAAAELPELIPAIDLRKLSTVDEAAKLQAALQTWGLFTVTGHGIEESLMDDVMNASREFFHQPIEEKRNCSNLKDGKNFQVEGYGSDQVKIKDQTMDWSDRLHLKLEPENERNFANWPTRPESFRDVLLEYALKSKMIKHTILRAMARILELDEDYFLNQFSEKAPITVRINHYVPCPRPNLVLGFKPHSDDGVLATLLVDNDLVALQVLKDGVWYNVPTSPRTILINIGDFMEIMSNGMFKSPVHRVVANGEKERTSLAMFYGLDPEKDIEPASGLLHVNQPAQYKKVKTKDYMVGFYEHFARGTRKSPRSIK